MERQEEPPKEYARNILQITRKEENSRGIWNDGGEEDNDIIADKAESGTGATPLGTSDRS